MPGHEKHLFDLQEQDKSINDKAISERMTSEIVHAVRPYIKDAKAGAYPLCDVAKTIVWVGFYIMGQCADPIEIKCALNEILVEVERLGQKEH